MNQKEGVFSAVVGIVGDWDKDQACPITSEQRKQVIEQVTEGLLHGEIELSESARAKYDTADKMRKYVNGLVSNWLRKDKRLNGNEEYQIKNPGSRAGAGDDVIKELRKLRSTFSKGSDEYQAIDDQIEKRLEQLRTEKAKTVTIDIDKIPEELRHLVGE